VYLFVVGKSYCETLPNLCINDEQIAWRDSLKYLDVNFISGKRLSVYIASIMWKFYAAANAIF